MTLTSEASMQGTRPQAQGSGTPDREVVEAAPPNMPRPDLEGLMSVADNISEADSLESVSLDSDWTMIMSYRDGEVETASVRSLGSEDSYEDASEGAASDRTVGTPKGGAAAPKVAHSPTDGNIAAASSKHERLPYSRSSPSPMTAPYNFPRDNPAFARISAQDTPLLAAFNPRPAATTSRQRRIQQELLNLHKASGSIDYNISYRILDDDIYRGLGTIAGPPGTPFEGGVFMVRVDIPETYPHVPMKMRFVTPMFHPNIGADGTICVDFLDRMWCPAITVGMALLMVSSLLDDPGMEEPLEGLPTQLFRENRDAYEERVREFTRLYATGEVRDSDLVGAVEADVGDEPLDQLYHIT